MAETQTLSVADMALAEVRRRTELRLRQKALPPLQPLSTRGGWYPLVNEPFTGAWQRNLEVRTETALAYSAVFACVRLICSDAAKLNLRLVQEVEEDIWVKIESPSFSPVLRRPNRYQNTLKFVEQWMMSKLIHGNTYVLKQRDNRGGLNQGVVTSMYILDPCRVTPLVTQDGAIYYELKRDDLSGIPQERIIVPASEIIHDTFICPYHPLIGVSPIYAAGLATLQGLSIQNNSNKLFSNGALPGGVLTAPGNIDDTTALRLKEYWDSNFTGDNVGKVAVLGDGLHYEPMSYNAVDMQLIDQLKWTGENVCTAFGVPAYMIGIGPPPPYANVEPLVQLYYNTVLHWLLKSMEDALDYGLGLGKQLGNNNYGVEFNPNDLIWMDPAAKTKATADGIGSGGMSPDEARKFFLGLGKVPGGDSPYLQQQMFSLRALAERDADKPFAKPEPAPTATAQDDSENATPRAASLKLQLSKAVADVRKKRAA